MKKILVFSTAYLPHIGGAEIAIQEIAARLKDTHAFHLICAKMDPKLPATETLGGVVVHREGWGIPVMDKLALPALSALRALKLGSFDLYWAMMVTYGSGGAYIARWFTKTPIVLTLQEGDPPEYLRRKWFGMLGISWRLALRRSAVVTVISSYLGELATAFGYTGTPALIPNGVNLETFGNIRFTSHEGVVLVTTSRLVHKNAVDDVLRALVLLPANVSFQVYGTGGEEGRLRLLAKELGVDERVQFKGAIAYNAIPDALSHADIFIRPSRSEGMGNSFIEAMAAGLPVIATQVGGIKDFLFDAKRNPSKKATGYAVDPDAPEQIAQAVTDILRDPEAARRTAQEAKALVKENYDWNLIARAMGACFDRAIEKR